MTTSADMGLPYITTGQAQPDVTHNEALLLLQALMNGVISRGVNNPPATPASADAYIVGSAPTGAWAGRANTVAIWSGTAWDFVPGETSEGTPIVMGARNEGMRVWVRAENSPFAWNGTAWVVESNPAGVLTTQLIPFDVVVPADVVEGDEVITGFEKLQANTLHLLKLVSNIAQGTILTGITSVDDPLQLSDLNDTTLRISEIDTAFFVEHADPVWDGNPVKSFPQQDVPLSSIPGLTVDGKYTRLVAIDYLGAVSFHEESVSSNPAYLQLGYVIVKRTAGVVTFLDTAPSTRNLNTIPDMAAYSNLERTLAAITFTGQIRPNANTTMAFSESSIVGPAINWKNVAGGGNVDKRPLPAQNPMSFVRVSPGSFLNPTPSPVVTSLASGTYWNGTAEVALTNNTASVQRVVITNRGGLVVQMGEFQYSNLDVAFEAMSVAPFTPIFPEFVAVEIARIATIKGATALNNTAQARFQMR